MTRASCPRLFEVEALRDGRLAGAERNDFERHLSTCRACSRETKELDELGEKLRTTSAPTDELHVRREKTRLLAAFDRTLVAPTRPWSLGRRALAFAALVALVVLPVVFFGMRKVERLPSPIAVVDADSNAKWSRRTEAQRDLVFLERGALRIQVTRSNGSVPLLVVLPDGELEDIGTTFSVSAESGRTTRVVVEEGSVLLRLRGSAPVAIARGQEWNAPPAPPTAPRRSAPLPPESAPQPPAPSASVSVSAHDASDEFRSAMAALHAGRNADAAARFARFVEQHPRDPRAQDATYMRILALQAAGDTVAMKAAAEAYLRAYPKGFRRNEVESLAR
jgi:hypothetical protein